MSSELSDKLQNYFIIVAIGLAIPPAIGFGFGFWTTEESAKAAVSRAVFSNEAEICVGQFTEEPDYQAHLKEFKALDYTAQIAYIEKGGWSKMPGEDKADEQVTRACGDKLNALAP